MDNTRYLAFGYDSVSEITSFFHASPHHFEVGDLLVPQPPSKRNFACSGGFVYLTDTPAPHYGIDIIAKEDGWRIYRVEPLGPVRVGLVNDLICERARVLECLGPASGFRGNSGVTMSSRYYQHRTTIMGSPDVSRIRLAERALGATVTFKGVGDKKRRKGCVVFADYDTLNVLIRIGNSERLVSLRDCKVLSLRGESVPVLHGARLDVWQHGEGWGGVAIADVRVADAQLEPLCEQVAA